MLWFRIDADFPCHRSSKRVLKSLGVGSIGAMVLLWCFVAKFGRDVTHPGRAVDSDFEPIDKADLVEASCLSVSEYDQLMEILLATKTISRAEFESNGIVHFHGICTRADTYTKKLIASASRKRMLPEAEQVPPPPPLQLMAPIDVTPQPSGFTEFWNLYPKHTTRKQAEAIWGNGERYTKGLKVDQNAPLYETIMTALTKHVQTWADEGKDRQFILSPYQYLKHRRWEDEAPPPPQPVRSKRTRAMQEAAAAFLANSPKVTPSDAEGV
jgi:hypothetical protein